MVNKRKWTNEWNISAIGHFLIIPLWTILDNETPAVCFGLFFSFRHTSEYDSTSPSQKPSDFLSFVNNCTF